MREPEDHMMFLHRHIALPESEGEKWVYITERSSAYSTSMRVLGVCFIN
jgi:hypothetical protein